jgi:hypothetical protein
LGLSADADIMVARRTVGRDAVLECIDALGGRGKAWQTV